MLESDQELGCPYCAQLITTRVDETAGRRQHYVIDCQVCCTPIQIEVDIDTHGYINLVANREGES